MLNRIKAIAIKEARQIQRDKKMLGLLFFFPVFLLGFFGYAINFDVKHVKLAVVDFDKSDISRKYIQLLKSSEYFNIVKYTETDKELKYFADKKIAQCIVIIPKDLSKNIFSGRNEKIQYILDGVDANTASIIKNYMIYATQSMSNSISLELNERNGIKAIVPLSIEPRFRFNPDLKTTSFLMPGLIAMILIVTCVVSISLSLVKEKEKGTIEQVNVSPIQTFEYIIAKTIPYIAISLLNAVIVLVAGYFLFDVSIRGSYLWLLIATFLFLFASICMGLVVSAISDSQQVAFQIASLISMLPSFLLSGFVYNIESMPLPIQLITNITPAKFYIPIMRNIMLRGAGLVSFWDYLLKLILFAAICLLLTIVLLNKEKKKNLGKMVRKSK